MEIIVSRRFYKKLKLLPKPVQKQVALVLQKLATSISMDESGLDYKKLSGSKNNFYRIRVGVYRIGIKYISPDIVVITICSRGDFYKEFPPQ